MYSADLVLFLFVLLGLSLALLWKYGQDHDASELNVSLLF